MANTINLDDNTRTRRASWAQAQKPICYPKNKLVKGSGKIVLSTSIAGNRIVVLKGAGGMLVLKNRTMGTEGTLPAREMYRMLDRACRVGRKIEATIERR